MIKIINCKNNINKLIKFLETRRIEKNNNLETFVLRKIAGSNFDGLRCMKNRMLRNKILIARPLLSYKKINSLYHWPE